MKKNTIATAFASVLLAACFFPSMVSAQLAGTKRTELQRYDLSTPGKEMVQARIDIAPGVLAPAHTHPGEEVIYVLEGVFEYQLDGQAPKVLRAGEVLFIPAGVPHSAKNIGKTNAAELATYIVEKGKPLVTIAKNKKTTNEKDHDH